MVVFAGPSGSGLDSLAAQGLPDGSPGLNGASRRWPQPRGPALAPPGLWVPSSRLTGKPVTGPAAMRRKEIGACHPMYPPAVRRAGTSWRLGQKHQSGLGDERVDQCRPVLDALQPGADDRGELVDAVGGEVAQAAFDM
jgi:hypothetical protein